MRARERDGLFDIVKVVFGRTAYPFAVVPARGTPATLASRGPRCGDP
jgi:hypothetical protein